MNQGLALRVAAAAAAALVLAGCGEVRAADPAATPAAAPAAAAGDSAAAPAAKDTGPATGAKPADGKASPLHFEPTEKTRADFEVSFPTDI